MIAYISGPMQGKPLDNFQEFEDVSKWIEHDLGWEVKAAHDVAIDNDKVSFSARYDSAGDYFTRVFEEVAVTRNPDKRPSMAVLVSADAIIMLPKWQESRGAIKELLLAMWCGLRLMTAYRTQTGFRLLDIEVTEDSLVSMLSAHHSGRKVTAA